MELSLDAEYSIYSYIVDTNQEYNLIEFAKPRVRAELKRYFRVVD